MKRGIQSDLEFLGLRIITPISFLKFIISNKHTSFGTWIKLSSQVLWNVNIDSTTKDPWFKIWKVRKGKKGVHFLLRGLKVYNARKDVINEISSRFHSLSPIKPRHIHAKKRGTNHFQQLSIFSLCQSILLRSIGARGLMTNTKMPQKFVKKCIDIFCTIVRL